MTGQMIINKCVNIILKKIILIRLRAREHSRAF